MPYNNYALEHRSGWMVKLGRRSRLPIFRHTAVVSVRNAELQAVAIQSKGRTYFGVQEAAILAFNYNIANDAVGELRRADRDLTFGRPMKALTCNTVEYLRDKLNVVLSSDRGDSPSDVSKWQATGLCRDKKKASKRYITGVNDGMVSDEKQSLVLFGASMSIGRADVIRRSGRGESQFVGTKSLASLRLELPRRSVQTQCPSPTLIYPDGPEDFWRKWPKPEEASRAMHALPATEWRPFEGSFGVSPTYTSQAIYPGEDDHFVQTALYQTKPCYDAFQGDAVQPPSSNYLYPGLLYTVTSTPVDQRTVPTDRAYRSLLEPIFAHELESIEHQPLDRQSPDRRRYQREAFPASSQCRATPVAHWEGIPSPGHRDASFGPPVVRVEERPTAGERRVGPHGR